MRFIMAKHPQGATKHKRKRTVKINDKWYFSETITKTEDLLERLKIHIT